MLGRAGGLAHRLRGKRGQSGCLCFIWNCPPQATRGRPRLEAVWPVDARTHARSRSRQRTHKTRPAHARPLKPFTTDQSCVSLGDLASRLSSPASCRCRGPRGRPPLAALNPPLTGMFILRAVTFRSFRRDCVFSQRSLSTVYKHSDTGSSVY